MYIEREGGAGMKYIATLKIGEQEVLVLPRTRKSNTFASVKSALVALERAWRDQSTDALGIVKNMYGEFVTNIAL